MASPVTLAQFGEEALVAHLVALLPQMPGSVCTGPGDDCAVVRIPTESGLKELLKVDSVVEGVHFTENEDMRRVGWKALCRAVSDIASMGGRPAHALVTLAASPETPLARLTRLYEGLAKAALAYGVSIVGGETGKTQGPLVCSVFLTGTVREELCLKRSGGRPGDLLFVTGNLGGSLLSGWHLDFTPRLKEAQWLASRRFPSAMMDLSDGLAADAPRLARASNCGLSLFPEAIPRRAGCDLQQAIADGEDFELLMAVPPAQADALTREWPQVFPELPLTPIGRLTGEGTGFEPEALFQKGGYDHFQ